MKIALVSSTPVPPAYGGMDRLLEGLQSALSRRHPTDLVTLPVDERSTEGVLRGYYEFHNLDLSAYDAVISYKAPAYMLRHPVHVVYLSHRLRVFYDRWEGGDEARARLRRLIHWMDSHALAPARVPHIFTVGQAVSDRLLRWGGIRSTAIHHPSTLLPADPLPGEHFLAPGRLHPWKRIDLVIRAYRAANTAVPLVIAGSGPHESELRALAAGDPRIRFAGHVDEPTLRDLYARALAVLFTPVSEDLGLVTLEAWGAGKPLVTLADSGEPATMVTPGGTGWVCEPTPDSLAARLAAIAADPAASAAMQSACLAAAAEVTWDRLVDRLLAAIDATRRERRAPAASSTSAPSADRPIRLLVTDNQIIDPPVGGGRIRIWELYRHLPDDFTTTYLGTHDHPGPAFRDQWLAPNFREIVMPLTTVHFKLHEIFRRLTRGDATVDVTIPVLLGRASPRYHTLLAQLLPQADILLCAHPWMFPFLPARPGLPRVYDSQNCEAALKRPLLGRTLAGRWLARRVESVERRAVRETDLTLACSPADAAEFRRRYGISSDRILEIPNGVDCEAIQPAPPGLRESARGRLALGDSPVVLFVGSAYGPNNDAARWIATTLAPALPAVTFALAGGASDSLASLDLTANLRRFGMVDRPLLLDLYAAADLAINPVRIGSGTNIKMLDYMAAGLPVVTTDVGARGIAGRPGEHWIEAPLGDFSALIPPLLADPARLAAFSTAGRALTLSTYDWRTIAANLAKSLRALHTGPLCACCGTPTLAESGAYEICAVCGWEDDPAQNADPDLSGGANKLSLNEARARHLASRNNS